MVIEDAKEFGAMLDRLGKFLGVERREVIRRLHEVCDRTRMFHVVHDIELKLRTGEITLDDAFRDIATVKTHGKISASA